MIAKFKNRVDFTGLVSYAHDIKSNEKRERLLSYQGVCVISNETIADSFNTHLRRPDRNGKIHHIGQPVKHVSISFSPEDAHLFPDNEEGDRYMAQLVDEWLRGMGITNAQYIVARHFDKAHPHCHLVYSRIALDGSVISAYNEQLRSADVCKKIKLRHGLTFGNSSGEKVNRNRLLPVQRALFDLKTAVIAAADNTSSWAEFQQALEAQGIEACFSFNRTTGEVRGISFAKGDYRFAGSKLSKQKLTYSKLIGKFGELPNMGVRVLRTPSQEAQEGVGVLKTPSRNQQVTESKTVKAPYQDLNEGRSILGSPSRNKQGSVAEGGTATMTSSEKEQFEGVLPDSAPTEPSEVSLILLSVIVDFLVGPTVVESTGGGTSNDLDWNDERRRREEAREKQSSHKPFKRRR